MLDALLVSMMLVAPDDGASPAPKPGFGEEIVVTATRSGQDRNRLPVAVEVVQPEQLEASGGQRLDDMLRTMPGFSLLRDQSSRLSHPTTQSLSFRGLGGTSASRALVLVDGVPANDAFGGWVPWGRIPTEEIERVEVVRSGSVLWGNLGVGGAIQLVTRPAGDRPIEVRLQGGSFSTASGSASVGRRREGNGFTLGGRFFHSDGYYRLGAAERGPVDHRSGLQSAGADLAVDLVAAERWPIRMRLSWFDERRDGNVDLESNRVQLLSFQAGAQDLGHGAGGWSFHLFGSDGSLENVIVSASPDRTTATPSLDQFDVPGSAAGLDARWDNRHGRHAASIGGDLQWTQGETHERFLLVADQFTRERRAGGEQLSIGLYAQDLVALSERWTFSGALRLDSWKTRDGDRLEREIATGAVLKQESFKDRSKSILSPAVGLSGRVSERSVVRMAAYRGFRAPTPNELYKPFRAAGDVVTEANAELDPEVLEGADLGWEWRHERGYRVATTLFWDRLSDPVQNVTLAIATSRPIVFAPCGFVPTGGTCRQRRNLGAIRSRGLEWRGEYRGADGRSVSLQYAYADAVVTSAPGEEQLVGNRARLSPRHAVTLAASVPLGARATASSQLRYLSDRFEDDLNKLRVGQNVTLNLRLAWPIGESWELSAGLENALDRENVVGRIGTLEEIGAPRALTVGARWTR